MPQEDAHAQDTQDVEGTPEKIRIRFFTHASETQMHRATCLLRPTITVEDRERPVDLQWHESTGRNVSCSGSAPPNAIRAVVEMSPDPQNPRSIVIVTLEPPANATPDLIEELRPYARDIATELRRRTSGAAASIVPITPVTDPAEPKTNSARLIDTTKKTAKWGAILLIPPICFVGILILLVCLFMVIVAGFMAAGGD